MIQLRDSQNLPGMRVLQFAFDGNPQNPHLAGELRTTTRWPIQARMTTIRHGAGSKRCPNSRNKQSSRTFGELPGESREAAPALMRLAWSSSAALAIAPLQDLLNLGASARMNTPGQASGNWRWRITDDVLSPAAFDWLRDLTRETKRSPGALARAESAAREEIEVTR